MAQKDIEVIKKRIELLKKHIRKKSMIDKCSIVIERGILNMDILPDMIGVNGNGKGEILRNVEREEFEIPQEWLEMPLRSESLVQNLRELNLKQFVFFLERYRKQNRRTQYTEYGELFIDLYKDRYADDFERIERSYEKFTNDELELMLNYEVNSQRIDTLLGTSEDIDENIDRKDIFNKQKAFLLAILNNLSKTGCLTDLVNCENRNIREINKFLSDENKISSVAEFNIYDQIRSLDFEKEEDRVKLIVFARTYANKLAHNYDDFIMMHLGAASKITDADGKVMAVSATYNKLSEIMRDYDKAVRANRANQTDTPSFGEFFEDVLESQKRGDNFEFEEIVKRNGSGVQSVAKSVKKFMKSVKNNFENPEQLFIDITKKMEFADRLFEVKNRYTRILVDCFSQNSPYFMENFLPEGDDGVIDVYLDGYMQAFGGHYKSYEALAEDYSVQSLPKIPQTVSFSFFDSNDGHSFNTFVPLKKLTDAQREDFTKLWETIEAVENGTVDENKEYFKLEEVRKVFGVKKSAEAKKADLDMYIEKRTERNSYHDQATEKRKEMKRIKSSANSKSDEAKQRTSELQREEQLLKNKAQKINADYQVDINIPRLERELQDFNNEEKFFDVLKLRTALAIGIDFYKEKYASERIIEDKDTKLSPEQLEMAKVCLEYINAGFDMNLLLSGGIIEIKDPLIIDYCRRHSMDGSEERNQDVTTEHDEQELVTR